MDKNMKIANPRQILTRGLQDVVIIGIDVKF